MATFTASAAQAAAQARTLRVGLTAVKSVFSFDPAFSSSIGTTVMMIKVPAGATVAYLDFHPAVSGQYTLNVGDSVNDQRFFSNATISAGQGTQRPLTGGMMAYKYSADDVIQMRVSLASVITLGGAFYMNAIFSMDS